MHIIFDGMAEQIVEHMKGGEKSVALKTYTDGLCKIMNVRLIPGASIAYHKHETNCEVIFMKKGTGTFVTDGVKETVHAGEATYCPKGHSHSFANETDEDIEALAIVPEQP